MAVGSLIGEHGAAHIDIKDQIPFCIGDVLRCGVALDTGDIGQHIQTAKLIHNARKGTLHLAALGNIAVVVAGLARCRLVELSGECFARIIKHIH